MASFLEFLKSGKSAKEFIDASVLPQNVVAVSRVDTSPAPYEKDQCEMPESDLPTPQPNELSGVEPTDKAQDVMDQSVLESADEDPDDDFMRQLEALEKNT